MAKSAGNILVTGGAGYVGSIVAEQLLERDFNIVVLDNFHQGHRDAVLPGARFIEADIRDVEALREVFDSLEIDAVIHMAAESIVGFSVTDPKSYFQTNVVGGLNLLNAMIEHDVKKIIFSSSAAVYGEPQGTPIEESHPNRPVNTYGETKFMFERMLHWYGRAYGVKHISLRYFNAAGASQRFGEHHRPETHLIPAVLRVALNNHDPVTIFGSDYPTRDGSCIRDFVHVIDIAQAHILALAKIDELGGAAFNLGSGEGCSVLEVVEMARKVSGVDIPAIIAPRREGDPAVLVASSGRAKSWLGWKPEFPQLEAILESAWNWMKAHPNGYDRTDAVPP